MKIPSRFALLLVLAVCWLVPPATADDSDVFLIDPVPPNVMILLDSSGSMINTVGGQEKMASARNVVNKLIGNIDNVRFGVFRFNSTSDGGAMVAPIGEDDATMIDLVSSVLPFGFTPLGRATGDVQEYFLGNYSGYTCTGACVGNCGTGSGPAGCSSEIDFPSPIEYACQKNYVIIVTDGEPNGEDRELVVDMAESLYTTDHSLTFPGRQNVVVHTIGFDVPAAADLLEAAATAGGGSYHSAANVTQLEQALIDALANVIDDAFSFSLPLIPSTGVTGGDKAYFASFRPSTTSPLWEGFLKTYTRDADGSVPVDADGLPLASALAWDAGALLASRASSGRTIYTAVGGTRQAFTKSNGTVTDAMLGVSGAIRRAMLIDFIRGVDAFDWDSDGNRTEDRDWKLGDIFHSAPVLVFPPPLANEDASYAAFKAANASRTTVALVGANDGMLHAFRESDGFELWAFIPPDLLGNLGLLSEKIAAHPYFVDSSPVVADVKTDGTWKTIAVFGERRGGSQYHALDITDTTNPQYLWSFSDAELGETWSEPAFGKVRMADGTDRYVAFVGGGYDTADNNASGRAVFAIDLATGTKLWEYATGGSNDAQYMNFSIPASPTAADLNQDGYTDRLYVGDVGGQLWKFDVSAEATLSSGEVDNWTGKRLFAAAPTADNPPASGEFHAPQAIYGSPALAFDASGELWVFFGTGDRNNPRDAASNYFFGVKDTTTMTNGSALTEASLVEVASGDAVTQGWYLALSADEKSLNSPNVFNRIVYFSTYTPELTDVCNAGRGLARLYAVRMEDGLPGIDWPTGHKLPNPDGTETPSTSAGGGIASDPEVLQGGLTDTVVVNSSDGELTELDLVPTRRKQLRYWREVLRDGTAQTTEEQGEQQADDETGEVQ